MQRLLLSACCRRQPGQDVGGQVKCAFPFCRPWLVDVLYLVGGAGWWINWEYVAIDVGANELVLDRAERLGDVLHPGAWCNGLLACDVVCSPYVAEIARHSTL